MANIQTFCWSQRSGLSCSVLGWASSMTTSIFVQLSPRRKYKCCDVIIFCSAFAQTEVQLLWRQCRKLRKLSSMAGRSKQYDFIFDGGLNSHTRASLVIELIKYLLYERNQIPLHFDGLKQQTQIEEVTNVFFSVLLRDLLSWFNLSFKFTQQCYIIFKNSVYLKISQSIFS